MTTHHEVIILNTKRQLKFGFGALRKLSIRWKCKGLQEVIQIISDKFNNLQDLEFEATDKLADIVLAALENARVDVSDIDRDDLIEDIVINHPEKLEGIMEAFAQSLPQQPETPEPAKKKVTKKTTKKKKTKKK